MSNAESGLRWISARDAREIFLRATGRMRGRADPPVEIAIAELAFVPGNAIRTRAVSITVDDQDTSEAFDAHGMLPTTFWEPAAIKLWAKSSNWPLGMVAGVHGDQCAIAHGVMFCAEDLERLTGLIPSVRTPAAPRPASAEQANAVAPAKSRGGAPRESEKWDAVTLAIARLANEGRLDKALDERFKTQADMRRAILDDQDVAALGMSEDTLTPLVRKVFNALLA